MLNKRNVEVGLLAGASALAKFLPSERLKRASKRYLHEKMSSLRGIPMKLNQILEMNETDLEGSEELIKKEVELPIEEIRSFLEHNSADFLRDVQSISEKGIGASLGQVHCVTLMNGRKVALKVRYFDSEKNMQIDTSMLSLVTENFSSFKKGFDLDAYSKTLSKELDDELDYKREAEMQKRFEECYAENEEIVIPKLYDSYSKDTHLVMSWEEGLDIYDFLAVATEKQKRQAGKLIATFVLKSLLEFGLIYPDMNFGNFAFRLNGDSVQLVVYDFGACRECPLQTRGALLNLLHEVEQGKGVILPWLVTLGFEEEKLLPLKDNLLAFLDMLFEPFTSESRFKLKEWQRKERAKHILGKNRMNFMLAAPADFLSSMRCFQGMFAYFNKLTQDCYLKPILDEISIKTRDQWQSQIPVMLKSGAAHFKMSNLLYVKIYEGTRQKIALSLPRQSIEDVESLMDAQVLETLEKQEIDLQAIKEKVRKNGYRAMDVFDINVGEKRYHVYLD